MIGWPIPSLSTMSPMTNCKPRWDGDTAMPAALDSMPPTPSPGAVRTSRRRRRIFILTLLAVVLIGQEVVFRLVSPLPEVVGFNRIRYQPLAPGDARLGAI